MEVQCVDDFVKAVCAEIDASFRPPVFYSDGSVSLQTIGCGCCATEMDQILKLGDDPDVDESWFSIYMGKLSDQDRKAIQIAWLKAAIKALKLTKSDLEEVI
jgi:hypothetical protein